MVTGGARRVGAAVTRELALHGADVLIHTHSSKAEGEALARELPGRNRVLQADLRAPSGAEKLLEEATQAAEGRSPDILVHAAASFLRRPVLETTAEDWDAVHALNTRAFFLLARGLAALRGGEGGDLIAIGDAAALELWPGYLAHSVSKAALLSLVRALAKALAPGFRVNAVVPGPVLLPEGTPADEAEAIRSRTLLDRLGRPEHVAQAVRFLLECDYATGSALEITGGSNLWRGVAARRQDPTGVERRPRGGVPGGEAETP
ncbi:MAG: SDR family oxidoreductase [Acidobacteria bacterium]|nr:SDR family oxidoreductase [Acidobacteriota bacterium]